MLLTLGSHHNIPASIVSFVNISSKVGGGEGGISSKDFGGGGGYTGGGDN